MARTGSSRASVLAVPATPPAPTALPAETWIVHWDHRAVEELQARDRSVLKGVLTVVDFLHRLGPKTVEPHSKALTGERKLRELRPGGGRILVRPLYIRWHDREFVILALAPESQVDPSGFRQAVARAKQRAKADWGLEV
jgi:hypothetical protein